MRGNYPVPPKHYDATHQANLQRALEQSDKQNIKQGHVFEKILMKDTVTGETVTLTVASGSLVIT